MDNKTIAQLIRRRAEELRDKAKYGGEIECRNCSGEAWLLVRKDGTEGLLCPNCGENDFDLDWTDLSKPLPRPRGL